MSNIDKQALREAAEKALLAGDGKWSVWREAGQKYPEIFTSSGHIVATVNGAFPVARSDFIAAANPTTVLALLDELEAAESRIADQCGIIASARKFISEYAGLGDVGAAEFIKIIDRAVAGKGASS